MTTKKKENTKPQTDKPSNSLTQLAKSGRIELLLDLSKITLDDDKFRCRLEENAERIEKLAELFTEYIDAKNNGRNSDYPLPAIVVWKQGKQHILIAGYHRYYSALEANLDKILVEIFEGTEEQAKWFAMTDNNTHGLRLSGNDLKHCIGRALALFPDKTAGAIARELGFSRPYAYKIEKQLSATGQLIRAKKKRGADNKLRSSTRKTKPKPVATPAKSVSDPVPDQQSVGEGAQLPPNVLKQIDSAISILNDIDLEFSESIHRDAFYDKVGKWALGKKADAMLREMEEQGMI